MTVNRHGSRSGVTSSEASLPSIGRPVGKKAAGKSSMWKGSSREVSAYSTPGPAFAQVTGNMKSRLIQYQSKIGCNKTV
jgi:hypothetical protein